MKKILPIELVQHNQWINYHSAQDKRPIPSGYKDKSTHKTFDEAYSFKPEVGFVPYQENSIALLDFDNCMNLKHLSKSAKEWIGQTQPYIERSPSGNGLRAIVKVSPENKRKIKKAYAKAKDFDGQITFHTNYQTITGNKILSNYNNIPFIPIELLSEMFNVKLNNNNKPPTQSSTQPIDLSAPSFKSMQEALAKLPLTQSDKVLTVYKKVFKEKYEHYNYWMYIGMALYDWGVKSGDKNEAFKLWDSWSSEDADSSNYPGPEDLFDKWKSFITERDERITWKTIRLLANHFLLVWPIPKANTKENTPPQPAIHEYKNFLYLFQDYLGLELTQDSMKNDEFYLSNNKEVCEKYVTPMIGEVKIGDLYGPINITQLQHITYKICQDYQYRMLPNHINNHNTNLWLSVITRKTNIIKLWLDMPAEKLPPELQYNNDKQSTFDNLFDCITFQGIYTPHIPHFKQVIKKAFIGWIKMYYYKGVFDSNNLLPVLTGPENCRKSTFIKMLLPLYLSRRYIFTLTQDMKSTASYRDANRSASGNAFLELAEVDRFLSDDVAPTFKAFVSEARYKTTDKYDKHETIFKRHALIFGTTNSDNLILSRDGRRRSPILPVEWIDTDAMTKLNLHSIYTKLRDEVLNPALKDRKKDAVLPWVLTEDEISYAENIDKDHMAKTDLRYTIEEFFDLSAPINDIENINNSQTNSTTGLNERRFWKINDLAKLFQSQGIKFKISHLKRELKEICSEYTNTNKTDKIFGKHLIHKGQVTIGEVRPKKYWVLPLVSEEKNITVF